MKRRVVSLVLSVCLLGNGTLLFAGSFQKGWGSSPIGQMSDFLQNGDGGGDYYSNVTNPSSTASGLYGGTVEFRINALSAEYKPWVDFQAPSVKTSCSGMSLSAGFLEGISLEDLAEQLGNASGALAYGIMIALVNSMPSIEHVFSKIKEVAQWMQGMLKNACNFGVQIGNAGKRVAGIKDGWGLQSGIDTMTTAINDTGDKILKSVEDQLSKIDSIGANKETNQTEATSNYEALFMVGEHGKLLLPERLAQGKLTNGWYGVNLTEITGDTNLEFMYVLAVNLFGASGVASQQLTTFFSPNVGGSYVPKLMAEGQLDKNKPEEKALINTIAEATKNTHKGSPKVFDGPLIDKNTFLEPSKSPTKLIQGFLGTGSNKGVQNIELRSVWIYEAMVKTSKKAYTMIIPASYGQLFTKQWKGIYAESEATIRQCVTAQGKYHQAGGTTQNPCGGGAIPIILPNAMEYIRIISEVKAKAQDTSNSNSKQTDYEEQANDLIRLLANMNAYYVAQYFLEYIMNQRIEGTSGVDGEDTTKANYVANVRLLEGYMQKIEHETFGKTDKARSARNILEEVKSRFQLERNQKQTSGANQ